MHRCRVVTSLLLLLSLVACTALYAIDEDLTGVGFAVAVGLSDGDVPTIQRIAQSSIVLHLANLGATVSELTLEPFPAAGVPGELTGDGDPPIIDFLIIGRLSPAGGTVRVDLTLADSRTGQILGNVLSTEEVGLTFDRSVADLTDDLLRQGRSAIENAAGVDNVSDSNTPDGSTSDSGANEVPPTGPGDSAAPGPDQNETGGSDQNETGGSDPSAGPISTIPTVTQDNSVINRFAVISASFAPFMPVERAADYMGFSYGGRLSVVLVPLTSDAIGLGISTGVVFATAAGVATEADLLLLPLAATIRFSGNPTPVAPYLALSGGTAFLQASHETLGTSRKFIPYAAGQLGVRAELFGGFGFDAAIGFDAYFEGSLAEPNLILGFSPLLGLSMGI